MRAVVKTLVVAGALAAAVWMLFFASRNALVWVLVAVYCLWPAVWLVAKPFVMAMPNLLFPAPLGKVFSDVSLLDVPLKGGKLERARIKLIRLLARYAEIGLWPAGGLTGRTLHTVSTGTARELRPWLPAYAVISAILALLLVGIRAWSGPSLAVSVATVGLLTTITARHLLWIVSGEGFRLLLRRSQPNPFVTLVTLAVFDCVALVGIATVVRWTGEDALHPRRVVDAGTDLFSLRHVTRLTDRSDLSPLLIALAVAVTAYWTSLASQVIKVTAFLRDYDDRAWVAALWLDQGDVEQARSWLAPVPALHVTGPVQQVRIRLALADSEFERALALSRALAGILDPQEASQDGPIVYLSSQLYEVRAEPGLAWQVIDHALATHISDGAMFAVLTNLRDAKVAEGGWEERARTAGLSAEGYPLAWSWLVASYVSVADARALLDATRPTAATDIAVRQVARFSAWRESTLFASREDTDGQLAEMLAVLPIDMVERWPYWLRDYVLKTTWSLEQRAIRHELPRRGELRAVRRRLLGLPEKQAEAILEDTDVTQRARLRAAQTSRDVMFGIQPW